MNPDTTAASLMQQNHQLKNANAQQQQQRQQQHYPVVGGVETSSCSSNSIGAAAATVFDDLSSLPPPPPQLQGGANTEATIRCRPQVPPKPQIDLVRYSMANAKEDDLDAILGELYELGKQLSTDEGSNNFLMGLPALPVSSSQSSQLHITAHNAKTRADSHHSLTHLQPDEVVNIPPRVNTDFCASPDVDSAFGDSSSTDSIVAL
uniref:Uncharacterized protein n=1 Tax=Panagrolaimus sp. PS1159 TaxID=55785 RepID=A0AC35G9C4_9BILA